MKHNIVIQIPDNDSEFVGLITEVSELIKHIEKNPNCKFLEISDNVENRIN